MATLAVAGNNVPLVECHAMTRERWTANLTTFSNEERFKKEGPLYCEIMFKASPEGPLEQRLRDHVRSRGYGPWVPATTFEKKAVRATASEASPPARPGPALGEVTALVRCNHSLSLIHI